MFRADTIFLTPKTYSHLHITCELWSVYYWAFSCNKSDSCARLIWLVDRGTRLAASSWLSHPLQSLFQSIHSKCKLSLLSLLSSQWKHSQLIVKKLSSESIRNRITRLTVHLFHQLNTSERFYFNNLMRGANNEPVASWHAKSVTVRERCVWQLYIMFHSHYFHFSN